MTTVLAAGSRLEVGTTDGPTSDALWLDIDELRKVSGWQLKPEGLCRDDQCVPLAAEQRDALVDDERVNASGLWEHLDRPVLHDANATTWLLGEGAEDRAQRLESLVAPDFALPDIDGTIHKLSDQRGKKILLVTWASW